MIVKQHEWVRLSDYVFASPLIQSLTAVTVWPRLTPKQRELVASCRVEVDPKAFFPNRYKVIVDKLVGQPLRTRVSLEAKDVVDERGVLTIDGIYTALWNQLEHDLDKKAAKAARQAVAS
jgi:hypothetical protein